MFQDALPSPFQTLRAALWDPIEDLLGLIKLCALNQIEEEDCFKENETEYLRSSLTRLECY